MREVGLVICFGSLGTYTSKLKNQLFLFDVGKLCEIVVKFFVNVSRERIFP
jgi:hypothetical protein